MIYQYNNFTDVELSIVALLRESSPSELTCARIATELGHSPQTISYNLNKLVEKHILFIIEGRYILQPILSNNEVYTLMLNACITILENYQGEIDYDELAEDEQLLLQYNITNLLNLLTIKDIDPAIN